MAVPLCLPTYPCYSIFIVWVGWSWRLIPDFKLCLPVFVKSNSLQDPRAELFRHIFWEEVVILNRLCYSRVDDCFSSCWASLLGSWWLTVDLVCGFHRMLIPLTPSPFAPNSFIFDPAVMGLFWWLRLWAVFDLSPSLLHFSREVWPEPQTLSWISWLKCYIWSKKVITALSTSCWQRTQVVRVISGQYIQ